MTNGLMASLSDHPGGGQPSALRICKQSMERQI